MPILPPTWLISEGGFLPCVDNTECQHSTPSLGNKLKSSAAGCYEEPSARNNHQCEIIWRTCRPATPLDILDFYPWIKSDDPRTAFLDQMALAPCGSRFIDLCLVIRFEVSTEAMLEGKALSLAIIFTGRRVFFKLPVWFLCSFWKSHMGNPQFQLLQGNWSNFD